MFDPDFALLAGADIIVQQACGELVVLALIVLATGIFTILLLSGLWKIFVKEGKPGRVAIIPVLHVLMLLVLLVVWCYFFG